MNYIVKKNLQAYMKMFVKFSVITTFFYYYIGYYRQKLKINGDNK